MVEILINGSLIVLFVILGFVFLSGKGGFLIAGYNTMSEEEKKKINEGALLKTMGKLMFALAFIMLFWIFSSIWEIDWLFYVGLVLFLLFVFGTIIRVNTSKKYKNKDEHHE